MNNVSHPLPAKIMASLGIFVITLIVVGVIVLTRRDAPAVTSTTPSTMSQATTSSNQTYRDGTYTETGSYSSPAGRESLNVKLTLASGVITDSTVTREANDQTASSYQGLFISGYKSMVNGKKISDVKLSNVAGSSLTPQGFMDALRKIESDAKA